MALAFKFQKEAFRSLLCYLLSIQYEGNYLMSLGLHFLISKMDINNIKLRELV